MERGQWKERQWTRALSRTTLRAMRLSRASFGLLAVFAVGCAGSSSQGAGASAPVTTPGASSVAPSTSGAGDPDSLDRLSDEQLVRKLLEVTGASGLGKQIADSMMDTFRKMPNLPPGFVDRIKQNIHAEELTDLIVPVYLKHYDRKTMLAAIHFYQSDSGRVLVKALPVVTAESMEVGKTWGRDLAQRTLKDLGIAPGSSAQPAQSP
jgi:hypothetical protein